MCPAVPTMIDFIVENRSRMSRKSAFLDDAKPYTCHSPKCDNRSSSMPTSLTSAFSPETIRHHGLTLDEYEKIKQLLGGRELSLTELGIFSVMWSEHCS